MTHVRTDAPGYYGPLGGVTNMVGEVVSRWKRSTAIALSNIQTYEDILTQKNSEAEALAKRLHDKVCVCTK